MRVFGDVVYNLYGSTEAAYATIATPEDLRAAPACVGRAPYGTTVRILDADGRSVPTGQTGTVYVGSVSRSTGYTGGGGKPIVDGLMSTGDVGHVDATGRLYIDGRDDDMVVSGGENVFLGEVADLLSGHPDIGEVAVLGVPDDVFGRALRAFVVRRDGRDPTEDDVKAYVKANLARYKDPPLGRLPRHAPAQPDQEGPHPRAAAGGTPRLALCTNPSPPGGRPMAGDSSFDIVSKVDRQEVDNALNQTAREISQRFDFKNTGASIQWQGEYGVEMSANSDDRALAILDVFKGKLIKRGISLKALDAGEPRTSGREVKIGATLKQGIATDQAKQVSKLIRDEAPKGVKVQIQGDELRVSSKKKDDLQSVIALVKDADLDFAVQFVNYR